MNSLKKIALATLLASVGLGGIAHAESNLVTAAPYTTTARLDFKIVIPGMLFLQVGTGSFGINGTSGTQAVNGTIDKITFTVPVADLGTGTAIAGTGGDQAAGAVTAIVRGNVGNVTLSSTTNGALTNGNAGETISWAQISTTAAALGGGTVLPVVSLVDGATTSTALTATNKVVNQRAKWTYSYLNANLVAAGTYGDIVGNNGRVTYTVSNP